MMSPREEAQNLADQARAAEKPAQALALAQQALEHDGECTDAQVILAQLETPSPRLLARQLRIIVDRAEARLGTPFLREQRGRIWEIPEAHAYLRARRCLAEALDKAGRPIAAIPHLEGILTLDPEDHLKVRPQLVCMMLTANQLKGLPNVLRVMEEGAFKAWAIVLAKLKEQDDKAAQAALEKARRVNGCVEEFLTGRRKAPRKLEDDVLPGSPEEAVIALKLFGETWSGDRKAMYWLFRQS